MRSFALLAVLATLIAPARADARLFWQTYGATVAADGGCGPGCAWNINQDYFVPRHCDSCQYGLFGACKTDHSRSAACSNLHPVYGGYCTPYSSCRYKWRDHVYKVHCGCMPLHKQHGSWRLDKCRKHALVCRHADTARPPACGLAASPADHTFAIEGLHEHHRYAMALQNVEPFGGETLGSVPALPGGASGGGPVAVAIPLGSAGAPTPKLNLTPTSNATSGGLPAPFDY